MRVGANHLANLKVVKKLGLKHTHTYTIQCKNMTSKRFGIEVIL